MAGYGKISATATVVNCHENNSTHSQNSTHSPFNSTPTVYNVHVPTNHSAGPITERKIYIPIYINKYRVVGCLDSGSDLTFMHLSLYNKIKGTVQVLSESDIPQISTFSDNTINVIGKVNHLIHFSPYHTGIEVEIYIIPDVPNQTPLLLGNDLLRVGLGQISYLQSIEGPTPVVNFKNPQPITCSVYFTAPRDLYTCEANCTLAPFECLDVEFMLPPAAPVVRKDIILITSQSWDTISILPSRSDLEFVQSKEAYSAFGRVINLSKG
jgi:hypothetical protein